MHEFCDLAGARGGRYSGGRGKIGFGMTVVAVVTDVMDEVDGPFSIKSMT